MSRDIYRRRQLSGPGSVPGAADVVGMVMALFFVLTVSVALTALVIYLERGWLPILLFVAMLVFAYPIYTRPIAVIIGFSFVWLAIYFMFFAPHFECAQEWGRCIGGY